MSFLQTGVCPEQRLLFLHDGEEPVVITGHTAQIHRDDGLGLFGDGSLNESFIDVHGVGAYIHENQLCPVNGKGVCSAGEGKGQGNLTETIYRMDKLEKNLLDNFILT